MKNKQLTHKLVSKTLPGKSYENFNNTYNLTLNEVIDKTSGNDPEGVEEFFTSYVYDVDYDWRNYDLDRYFPSMYHKHTAVLAVSDNCNLKVVSVNNIDAGDNAPPSQITLTIDNQSISFDINQNVQELHKAAMIYSYVTKKLKKTSMKKGYNSRYHHIKLSLEQYFKDLSSGKQNNLNIDTILTVEEMLECISIAKATALKNYLIEQDIIPKETGFRKYPKTYEGLVAILPKVEAKYSKLKTNQIARQQAKEQKAIAKAEQKELKRAKIQERKAFKAQQKDAQKAKIKSVREVDFSK